MKKDRVSTAVIRRLPRYYRHLDDLYRSGSVRISSSALAKSMGLTASQIRQDFNCFGGFGQQGYGYVVDVLYREIGHILGMDRLTDAVLLGVGNLGKAIVKHMDFSTRGFRLVGLFDDAPPLAGKLLGSQPIRPTEELEEFCRQHQPQMAILCIPKEAAPPLVERLLSCGVRGFWNFSHYDIAFHHPEAIVENVHLGDSLMTLSYEMTPTDL